MLVAAVLILAPVVFVAGTAVGRAFGRTQAFDEAAALLRFDASRAAARGHRDDAFLLRLEAHRMRNASDGAPSGDEGESAREPMLAGSSAGNAGSR